MAQHDYDITNAAGAVVRADINSVLSAIAAQNSGAAAPSTTYAFQWWADTSTSPTTLRIRNAANSAWIAVGVLNTNFELAGTTTFGRSLIAAAAASNARSTLGLTDAIVTTTLASQAEAEAATNNTKLMTPLRTAEAIQANSPPGEGVELARKTASASSQIDFTETDNSLYKGYKFRFRGVTASLAGAQLDLRLSNDAGATFLAGTTDYRLTGESSRISGSSTSGALSSWRMTLDDSLSIAGNYSLNGKAEVLDVNGGYPVCQIMTTFFSNVTSSQVTVTAGGYYIGAVGAGNPFDAFRFFMSSGPISGGEFIMYGVP